MRDGLGLVSACAQPLREACELLGGFFRPKLTKITWVCAILGEGG
jgi:hypothetical protein